MIIPCNAGSAVRCVSRCCQRILPLSSSTPRREPSFFTGRSIRSSTPTFGTALSITARSSPIADGSIDLIVNTPHGSAGGGSARIDGYEIRTAAVQANVPCITTVQGLGAAVQGIEAMIEGNIGVRSLQDWARRG